MLSLFLPQVFITKGKCTLNNKLTGDFIIFAIVLMWFSTAQHFYFSERAFTSSLSSCLISCPLALRITFHKELTCLCSREYFPLVLVRR